MRKILLVFIFLLIPGFFLSGQQVPAAKPETEKAPETAPEPEPAAEPVRILIGGDVHYVWGVADLMHRITPTASVKGLVPLFDAADLRLLNLETVVSRDIRPLSNRTYPFNADPSVLTTLQDLKVQGVFLANNHSGDYGPDGVLQTLDHLNNAGIAGIGAGADPNEASSPYYCTAKGVRIAVFSYSTVSMDEDYANASRAGLPTVSQFTRALALARPHADHIIVGIHWGWEYRNAPDSSQRALARRFIDAGATAVVGHHPHLPQGVELYKNGVIYYSLGNLIFGSVNQMQSHNIMAELTIDPKTKKLTKAGIIPILGAYKDAGHAVRPLQNLEESRELWSELYVQTKKLSPATAVRLRIYENAYGEISLE